MDLTPIKIRGKKDRARRRPSIDSLPPQHPDYTTKRPFVPSPGSRISSAKIPRQLAARTNTISVLEQLPTELLDNIFFFCLNISLPQASPILGRKLASHHVKSQLVLQVLSASSGDEYPVPLSYIIPTLPQHADLQSRILRLRWMTPPFLQSLIPEYIVTTVLREFPKRSLLWRGKEHVDDKSGPMILESLKDNESLQDVWYGHNAEISQLTVSKYDGVIDYRAGWLKHQQNGATSPRNLTAEETGNSAHWRIFCGIAGCQIPEKILHGPWTEEKCDFLELLIRGNASIDWVRSTTGEVAERGLVDALREGNARAVKILLRSRTPAVRDRTPSPFSITYRRGVSLIPTQEHLRIAVLERNGQQDILEALFMQPETRFDVAEREIQWWLTEARAKQPRKAALLERWVKETTNY